MENTVPFLYLTESIRDEDETQDAIVLLLEQQPSTEAEAKTILTRLTHTKRNAYRKRPAQLMFEPSSESVMTIGLHDVISRLPTLARELVSLHYIQGMTVTAIASQLNLDYKTAHTELARAVDKLKLILGKENASIGPFPKP